MSQCWTYIAESSITEKKGVSVNAKVQVQIVIRNEHDIAGVLTTTDVETSAASQDE